MPQHTPEELRDVIDSLQQQDVRLRGILKVLVDEQEDLRGFVMLHWLRGWLIPFVVAIIALGVAIAGLYYPRPQMLASHKWGDNTNTTAAKPPPAEVDNATVVPPDAGIIGLDAAEPPDADETSDGGVGPLAASMPPEDAGIDVDAAVPPDAGTDPATDAAAVLVPLTELATAAEIPAVEIPPPLPGDPFAPCYTPKTVEERATCRIKVASAVRGKEDKK